MSIRTLSAFAVARNLSARPDRHGPTAVDAGEVARPTVDPAKENEAPTVPSLLAKLVPTEILALYTVFLGAISTLINEQDPLAVVRWFGFALLVVGSVAWFWIDYMNKGGPGTRKPWLEAAGMFVAAVALGLSMPESPLYLVVQGAGALGAVILLGFLALVINSLISLKLAKPAIT